MPQNINLLPVNAKARGSDFNALKAQLEAQRITGAAGLLAGGFGSGSTLAALGLPPLVRRQNVHPFKVFDASVASPAAAKVRVAYGTVNNFVPTIDGNSIFSDPAPLLTVVTGTVYLDATIDGAGAVTAVIISNAATTPVDTATNKYKTLASVTVTAGVVSAISDPQSVITSLTLYLCNGTPIWDA